MVKNSLNTFLLLLFCLGAVLGCMILVFYQLQTRNFDSRLSAEEEHSIRLQREVARNHFNSIVSDLTFLVGQEDLKTYLSQPSGETLEFVNSEYLTFSASKKIYDQIRYLDEQGQEVARVNYNDGYPAVVAKDRLQNKRKRFYFSDTLKLDRGDIFVSPLDLNIEHGAVEVPHKPMIRFATPVYDQFDNKRGVVLLNYLATHFLQTIDDVSSLAHGQIMLLDADGYWLKHPDARKEWGFMFAEKDHYSLAKQNPSLWNQILVAPSGQIRTPAGIYTFTTISPLDVNATFTGSSNAAYVPSEGGLSTDRYEWKIASFISKDTLASYSKGLLLNLFGFGTGLFILTVTISWFMSMAITKRNLYQAQLFSMAHFDNLTGLPNRSLFFDRLEQVLKLAKRFDRVCALLYVDLDGFKRVNDELGHDAGDQLLVEMGKRMQMCCRDSDTVARLGGDEFAVLLTEISAYEHIEFFAEKLLKTIQEPCGLTQGQAQVGASIGVAKFPHDGATLEELLKSADQAMYRAKKQGKNRYLFAE